MKYILCYLLLMNVMLSNIVWTDNKESVRTSCFCRGDSLREMVANKIVNKSADNIEYSDGRGYT